MPITIADPVLDITKDGRISAEDRMLDRSDVLINAKFVRVEGLSVSVRAGGENHTLVSQNNREALYDEFGVPESRNILFTREMLEKIHTFKQWFTGKFFKIPLSAQDEQISDVESEFNNQAFFNRSWGDNYSYRQGNRFLWNDPKNKNFVVGKVCIETHIDSEYFSNKTLEDYKAEREALYAEQQELFQKLTEATSEKQKAALTRAYNAVSRKLWLVDELIKRGLETERPQDEGTQDENTNEIRIFGDKYNYHEGNVTAYQRGDKKSLVIGTSKKRLKQLKKVIIGNRSEKIDNLDMAVINGAFNIYNNGVTYSKIGGNFGSSKGGMFRELVYGHNLNYRWGDIVLRNHGNRWDYFGGVQNRDTFGKTFGTNFADKDDLSFGETFSFSTHAQSITKISWGLLTALKMGITSASLDFTPARLGVSGTSLDIGDLFFSMSKTAKTVSGPSLHFGWWSIDKSARDVHGRKLKKGDDVHVLHDPKNAGAGAQKGTWGNVDPSLIF